MSGAEQNGVGFLYIRPSTASPLDAGEQERRIRLAVDALGLTFGAILREEPMTARQRRAGLPSRAALLRRLNGAVGTVLVANVAVLGRSLPDLVGALAEIEARGATVLVTDEGGAVRPIVAADLEAARRGYIREAVMEGRAKARARGVEFGRPRIVAAKVQAVRDALARGLGVRAAARVGGVGVATASRIRDARLPDTRGVT